MRDPVVDLRHAQTQTDTDTDTGTDTDTDTDTHRPRQTHRQTDRQTDTHTHVCARIDLGIETPELSVASSAAARDALF